jgi:hypothetical protein
MIPTTNEEAYEDRDEFSGYGSFIQIKLIDGSTLYTDWCNQSQWAKDHPERAENRRLDDFSKHINVGSRPLDENYNERRDSGLDRSFIARKRFIKGAPEYRCQVYPRNVISLSIVSAGWENILDDGQEPIYLYKDEIHALLNAARPNADYNPPALDSAIDALLDALNGGDED